MRISRALALAGLGSRRTCEEYVRRGIIRVNGEVVDNLATQVDPEVDVLQYRGKALEFKAAVYYMLNKPPGYTTTARDPHAKKTVYALLPKTLIQGSRQSLASRTRVFPVGRLDRGSCGLLLFTNDGELSNRLTHPRYGVGKWYEVKLSRAFDPRDGKRLRTGVRLGEGIVKAEKVRPMSRRTIRIMIREGKKREVRRIFYHLGYEVVHLLRISFGPILLGPLLPGRGRFLTSAEVAALRKAAWEPAA